MWACIDHRLALLELLDKGVLPRRAAQAQAHDWLAELPWTRAGTRRGQLLLLPEHRQELVALLDRTWPGWPQEHLALLVAGEPPTPRGWRRLQDRQRDVPQLPPHLNRRTAASLVAPGAKSSLTTERRERLGKTELTEDGAVRLRVPPGLAAHRAGRHLAIDPVVELLGEITIPDRALRAGLRIEGPINALLLVENLGAWRDLPRPDRWLLAHVPGWDTRAVRRLVEALQPVPLVHFGDLDPNGVRIHHHLRASLPGLRWLVPAFWREQAPAHPCTWPEDLDLDDAPALVRALARDGLWMEQEPLVLDPRLPGAMEAVIGEVAGG